MTTPRGQIPTTAQIRSGFAYLPNTSCAMHLSTTEATKFDRWLSEHDAQIRADERAKIAVKIADIHHRRGHEDGNGTDWCGGCGRNWPCPTAVAAEIAERAS